MAIRKTISSLDIIYQILFSCRVYPRVAATPEIPTLRPLSAVRNTSQNPICLMDGEKQREKSSKIIIMIYEGSEIWRVIYVTSEN